MLDTIVLLPKGTDFTEESGTFWRARPLSLLSCAYRAWARMRAECLARWAAGWAPEGARAYLPGRGAADCWSLVALMAEEARLSDSGACGLVMDLVNAFHEIDWGVVLAFLQQASGHADAQGPLVAWRGHLCSTERRFRLTSGLGPSWHAVRGFSQGVPLSAIAMVAIASTCPAQVGSSY